MRLYGLIGYPLSHSFSKKYFDEKFQKEQLYDCSFKNFELKSISELPVILQFNKELRGLSVTIPYKEKVLEFLDEKNEIVKETGSCNSIKIQNEKLTGYNTDVFGFEKSLLQKLKPHHTSALILGRGGAAKAVAYVLKKLNIKFQFVERTPDNDSLNYEKVTSDIIAENPLIINTTPAGMFPNVNEAPAIPYNAVTEKHFLFDLIYNPVKTIFLQKGESAGAAIQNGYDMLIMQAEKSWELWKS